MKKTSIILTLAAMLVAMVSCTKEKLPVSGKFTMTVNADKDTHATKDLSLDGTTLNALWKAGESVTVSKGETFLGHLYATTDGSSTTLSGTIEGEIAVDDVLTLEFLDPVYDGDIQKGTIEYIATHFDHAVATVTINTISDGNVTTTDAVFQNQQAIVKFTLQTMSEVNLSASQLVVSVDGTDYTVDPDNDINVLYVALPGFSNKDVTLTATVVVEGEEEDTEYEYTKTVSNVTFANGQYYTITARLGKIIELSSLSGNYEAQNGDILTGTLAGNYKISVADGATVTLRDATITCLGETTDFAGITCPGNATIVLEGTNNVIGGGGTENVHRNPGIYIAPNHTLTIQGSGTLNVSSNTSANSNVGAGIGGAWANSDAGNCGNIVINGGTINATGGYGCAGIGAGYGRTCQNITIAGGSVTATGGTNAAGIGSGFSGNGSNSSCGDISISDGTVNASGGSHATGIGTGYANGATNNTCGDISISGGTVTAVSLTGGAGIGSGLAYCNQPSYYARCGNISITGGTVTATGGSGGTFNSNRYRYAGGAGIGTGSGYLTVSSNTIYNCYSSCGSITIANTVTLVTATKGGGTYSAANSIGLNNSNYNGGTCGTVTIGGTVYSGGISTSPYTYPQQ